MKTETDLFNTPKKDFLSFDTSSRKCSQFKPLFKRGRERLPLDCVLVREFMWRADVVGNRKCSRMIPGGMVTMAS